MKQRQQQQQQQQHAHHEKITGACSNAAKSEARGG
jgi:hypothetical protein